MLISSGGRFSWFGGRSSRSFCAAHSAPVCGSTARPTALRTPEANPRFHEPSSLNRSTAARSVDCSTQRLHDDPTDTYIALSAPNTIVRDQWPPPPEYLFTYTGAPLDLPSAPSVTRATPSVAATYSAPLWNARPCGWFSPV